MLFRSILLVSKYNHDQEYAADLMAAQIMVDAGYDPKKYAEFLARLIVIAKKANKQESRPGSLFGTHPLYEGRVERINDVVKGWKPGPPSARREQRFKVMREKVFSP